MPGNKFLASNKWEAEENGIQKKLKSSKGGKVSALIKKHAGRKKG